MHNPDKSCKILRFSPIETMPEFEAEFLEQTFDVVAINYTDDGLEEYVCYAPLNFDIIEFKHQINLHNFNLPSYTEETLENKNWLKENVIKFSPFEVGDFLIYGIHETSCPPTSKIPVQVYAATAFGSEHQTTKMCLTAITELHKNLPTPPQKIMDMGTGSGILSIASAKIWNFTPQIVSADIDEEAVDVTANNAITNNTEHNIKAVLSNGWNNPQITQKSPYDIILANILANPLKEMCTDAYKNLTNGGYYIISGFVDNQEQDVIKHHLNAGFKHIKTYQIENWRAALLQK